MTVSVVDSEPSGVCAVLHDENDSVFYATGFRQFEQRVSSFDLLKSKTGSVDFARSNETTQGIVSQDTEK